MILNNRSIKFNTQQTIEKLDIARVVETGTLYVSFADTSFTDLIRGTSAVNAGGTGIGPNGKIATFNGAQQSNFSFPYLSGSYNNVIVAARVRATAAQAGTPGAAFGIYDATSQGGFGVGFDPSGNAGCAILTSGGAYLNARTPVGLDKWVTIYAQISGPSSGLNVAYIDGKPVTLSQGSNYIGDPRTPNEIAIGAQHRSSGFLRQFKGDIEWVAILKLESKDGGWQSLTDDVAARLYESGYPYNLVDNSSRLFISTGIGTPPSDIVLSANSVIEVITSSSSGVTQTHVLSSQAVLQSLLSSEGSVIQYSELYGNNSIQLLNSTSSGIVQLHNLSGNSARGLSSCSSGALQQLNILSGNGLKSVNLAGSNEITQENKLSSIPITQDILLSSAGILQSHLLLGDIALQSNYSTSGAISFVPTTALSANPTLQLDISNSGSVGQEHLLLQSWTEQLATSSNASVVQRHVLISNNSTQIVLSSSGAIGTSSSLLGNNAQQTNTSSSGFIIQASFLQGNVVKQLNLSSSGAITQGSSQPLTDAEIRQMFAMLQVAVAKLQTRIDAVL